MRLTISHQTRYNFEQAPATGLQQVRMTPQNGPSQTIADWKVAIEGGRQQAQFRDQHDNIVQLMSIDRDTTELILTAKGVVETKDVFGVIGPHQGFAPLWYYKRPTALTRPGKGVRKLVKDLGTDHEGSVAQLHALSRLIGEVVSYEKGATQVSADAETAVDNGAGVCQDHAHVFLSAARLLGFPARYVSGYFMLQDSIEQDAGHAWAEAHVDGLGWVGFDVSNAISPDERYVKVAIGCDYAEAAPVSGLFQRTGSETLQVSLQVQQ